MSEGTLNGRNHAEWEALLTRVDESLRAHGAQTPARISIIAQAPKRAPLTMKATTEPKDFSAMSVGELWLHHAAITNSTERTAFFRAHIKARAQASPEAISFRDLGAVSTDELWRRHAAITNGAERTRFFRAHIKPRLR